MPYQITLREAIENVLSKRENRTATTTEISEEIARNGVYVRGDGKSPRANQINARVRKCPSLEFVTPGEVRLISGFKGK